MKASEIFLNTCIIFFILIAFYHLGNRVIVCDITVMTSFPLGCNESYNYTIHQLDYYGMNYYFEFYRNNESNYHISNCGYKLYPIDLR